MITEQAVAGILRRKFRVHLHKIGQRMPSGRGCNLVPAIRPCGELSVKGRIGISLRVEIKRGLRNIGARLASLSGNRQLGGRHSSEYHHCE